MQFSPRFCINHDPRFIPTVFQLLDSRYQNSGTSDFRYGCKSYSRHENKTAFTPEFDIIECPGAGYNLYGELPGINRNDVNIEFTDDSTLTIRGCVEHSYSFHGRTTHGFVVGEVSSSPSSPFPQVDKVDENDQNGAIIEIGISDSIDRDAKYWIKERNEGEFFRSFSFSDRVDHDNVKASMKNGILSISVPTLKVIKQEKRKISIK